MTPLQVAIVRTGTANLASVSAAFERLSLKARCIESSSELLPGDVLVLPGVGTFAAGMKALSEFDWQTCLIQRLEKNQPTLAICLGLQLLARGSDESAKTVGLGILPDHATPFPENVCSPHLGWNRIAGAGSLLQDGFAYFANSFSLKKIGLLEEEGWQVATTQHGCQFVAAAQKGNWLVCQFHPELSGKYGLDLLERWLDSIQTHSNLTNRGTM